MGELGTLTPAWGNENKGAGGWAINSSYYVLESSPQISLLLIPRGGRKCLEIEQRGETEEPFVRCRPLCPASAAPE